MSIAEPLKKMQGVVPLVIAAGMIGIVAAVFVFFIEVFVVDEPVHIWNLIGMVLILLVTVWILFHKPETN